MFWAFLGESVNVSSAEQRLAPVKSSVLFHFGAHFAYPAFKEKQLWHSH